MWVLSAWRKVELLLNTSQIKPLLVHVDVVEKWRKLASILISERRCKLQSLDAIAVGQLWSKDG
jgi:hypothetical protein